MTDDSNLKQIFGISGTKYIHVYKVYGKYK
jgi:hypothetical protein